MLRHLPKTVAATALGGLLLTSAAVAQVGGSPTLQIITPSEGQTLYGQKVPILLSVENLTLTDYQSAKTKVSGQGHIHLWLDDANPTRESAAKIITDDFTYSDVPYGDHKLSAELVNNDHTSLTPQVATAVNFKTAPVATPSPVATSGFDKNTALVILVVVALVIFAAWWYTKEEEEETPESPRRQGSEGQAKSKVTKKTTTRKSKSSGKR